MPPGGPKLLFFVASSTFILLPLKSLPLNHSMAEVAVGGSSYVTVASPFGLPETLSLYIHIFCLPVFLSILITPMDPKKSES